MKHQRTNQNITILNTTNADEEIHPCPKLFQKVFLTKSEVPPGLIITLVNKNIKKYVIMIMWQGWKCIFHFWSTLNQIKLKYKEYWDTSPQRELNVLPSSEWEFLLSRITSITYWNKNKFGLWADRQHKDALWSPVWCFLSNISIAQHRQWRGQVWTVYRSV